jgi:Sensors of blue-light using FAD
MHGPGTRESIVEFSFISRASPGLPTAVFHRLAQQSRGFNTRTGLTGRLSFAEGGFEQVVEGCCGVVLQLVARILADPRHTSIRITAFGPIAARRFPDWGVMGFDLGSGELTTHLAAGNLYAFAPTKRRSAECAASGAFGEAG